MHHARLTGRTVTSNFSISHFQFQLDVHTYFTSIGGVRMELSSAGSVHPSVILTKAVPLENAEFRKTPLDEFEEDGDVANNDVVSITDAKDVAPSRSSFMWPSCRCPLDDEDATGGHFIVGRKPQLCGGANLDKTLDFGHVDDLSPNARSLEEGDVLWQSIEIDKAGPVYAEKHLSNGVEGSHVVVATGLNGKGMVAMGGVIADMDGPVRATAHLPDYCFVGKDVFLKLVIDNRRNTTHYVVMEVISNAKFDFVGGDREVKQRRIRTNKLGIHSTFTLSSLLLSCLLQPVRSKDFERSVPPLSTAVILIPVRPVLRGPLRIRSRIKNSPHYLTASTVVGQSGGRAVTCREIVDIDLTNRPYFVGNLTKCVPSRFGGVTRDGFICQVFLIWRDFIKFDQICH